ncbi:AraC family transcriptional regulator [Burkholderia humptydooensis]|uniref:AraC family transcriptional regulator n=1 Tax=Burkholderia humptydooensis TaxID=430531 RepID=A0A7T2X0J8_9BURK|nr:MULTISPECIES: AraC family transcriptional regulator [Burkholderia]AJY40093.1 helix-turn-helix domain protein [Burkholderia sp. 2002721687]QPS46332.1 AraC family transcriptional regulator [Burkholderia humptydooensis]
MKPAAMVVNRTAAQRPAPLHTIFITLEVMKRIGLSKETLLVGTGIAPSDIERPNAMVTHAQEMVLFANALKATGNSAIGLHIGNEIPVTAYGLRAHAMLVSPTLGDAMRLAFEHPLLGISYFRMRLSVDGDTARIIVGGYTYRSDLLVVNTDMCFTAVRRQMIDLIGKSPNFTRIGLIFSRPSHADSYSEYFPCHAIFDSDENFLEFDASILNTKLPLAHPIEYEIAKKACAKREFELAHWMPTDLVGQLLCLMYENPTCQDIVEFAEQLGMSLRSLQRRLKDMGTSFSALQDLVRQDIASKYLSEKRYTAKEIASRLGYKNASAFSRAMKRWSKLTVD